MATIPIVNKPSPVQIVKFIGLNSNEESETQLQLGEACDMRNIRIDEGYKLETVEGYELFDTEEGITQFGEKIFKLPIHVKEKNKTIEMLVYNKIKNNSNIIVLVEKQGKEKNEYNLNVSLLSGTLKEIIDVFSYKGIPYMVLSFENENEEEKIYYVSLELSNNEFIAREVVPYIPLVAIGTLPSGGGTDFEQINLLTTKKRQTFSPDGTATVFTLREKNLSSVDKVIVEGTGKVVTTDYTVDLVDGTVTFLTAPNEGSDTVEIQWTGDTINDAKNKALVLNNKNHIFYGDGQDTYIFLYGNPDYPGRITYSDIGDTNARVDYFPVNNFMIIGDGTKQITGIVKQYDRLVISLFDSMYYAQYEELTTNDSNGNETILIALKNYPLNDTIGCKQSVLGNKTIMALLDNSPVVINEKGMYLINQTNVRTETNAEFISQRVQDWLDNYTVERTYDLESKHEYWMNGIREEEEDISIYEDDIVGTFNSLEEMQTYENPEIGNYALLQKRSDYCVISRDLYRYSTIGWTYVQNVYKYSNEWLIFNYNLNVFYKFAFYDIAKDIIEANGELYIINKEGIFNFNKNLNIFGKGKYDYQEEGDKLGRPINSYWEMGYYNFGYEYKRKMLTRLWASVMPYPFSNIDVDIETDRGLGTQQYYIYMSMANFSNVRFDNFSFDTVYNPKPKRIKIKAKKFVYLKLKLSNSMFDTKFKILQLTMDWQLGGEAK